MTGPYEPQRIQNQIRPFQLSEAYRLIPTEHEDQPLRVNPHPSRFCDPRQGYSVLYAAVSLQCAVWEGLLRNRFARRRHRLLGSAAAKEKTVVTLYATADLELVDLRDDGPARIGAPTAVTHDTNHAAGRSLSSATYMNVPEADGFLYTSRFTGHTCVAVFDRAVGKLAVRETTSLIELPDFLQTLIDYDISLISTDQA